MAFRAIEGTSIIYWEQCKFFRFAVYVKLSNSKMTKSGFKYISAVYTTLPYPRHNFVEIRRMALNYI